jgi:hypothetical protein
VTARNEGKVVAGDADLRDLIKTCEELKKLPHLYRKAAAFWGYPEFFGFVDSVLMIEADPNRGFSRQGLPPGAYAELEMLRAVFLDKPEQVAAVDLMPMQRLELEEVLRREADRVRFNESRI